MPSLAVAPLPPRRRWYGSRPCRLLNARTPCARGHDVQGSALRVGGSEPRLAVQAADHATAGDPRRRALLQAGQGRQQQQQQQQQQPGVHPSAERDFAVEDAILQTFAPPEVKQPRRQAQQEAAQRAAEAARAALAAGARPQVRQQAQQVQQQQQVQQVQRGRQTPHEAAHSRLLEKQRQQVVAQEQRVAALKEEERQQASLGRGSLRSRAGQAKPAAPVAGSNPADAFAQQTERQLAAARLRRAAQQGGAAAAAVAAEGGQLGGQLGAALAGGGGVDGHQLQHLLREPHGHQLFTGADGVAPQPPRPSRIPLLWIIGMTLVMAAAEGEGTPACPWPPAPRRAAGGSWGTRRDCCPVRRRCAPQGRPTELAASSRAHVLIRPARVLQAWAPCPSSL